MKLSDVARKMVWAIGLFSLVFIGAGIIYYRSFPAFPFAIGIFLTAALNVIKVFMLERAIRHTVSFEGSDAGKNYAKFQYFLRFLLTGAGLAAAALISRIDMWGAILWGAAAGLLTFQMAAFSMKFMRFNEDTQSKEGDGI